MGRTQGKLRARSPELTSNYIVENLSDYNESHQMTLDRPFGAEGQDQSLSSTSIEYHLTIQITNSSLGRKELGLLLGVLNFQAVHFGMNFNMVMAMYELYFKLLGNKRKSTEIREGQLRLVLTVTEILLKTVGKLGFSLYPKEVLIVPDHIKDILKRGLMSRRTYGSRYRTYRPEKFLRVRIVPVDIQFLNRRKDTEPYSSYCKGYGESHPSAHSQRLKPSAEYDGSGLDLNEFEEQKLFETCTDPIHLLSAYLLIRYSNEETEEK